MRTAIVTSNAFAPALKHMLQTLSSYFCATPKWPVATARERLSLQLADPWDDYRKRKQTLTAAMTTLGFKPKKSRA